MKAMVCTKYGSPEVFRLIEMEKPVPQDNEVLIKVRVAAVTVRQRCQARTKAYK